MKSQTYKQYKPSGIECLGEIPAHWEVIQIKRITSIPVTDGPHETPEFLDDGIPFISAEAIKNDKIDFSKKRGFISAVDHARFSKKYKPKKGDVYIVKSGATTGNVAYVATDDEEFNIWSPLAVIRPHKRKTITLYVFFLMKSLYFFQSIEISWSYGTQQNIGMNVIENLSIALPPLSEQLAIADFLDHETTRIDQLIAKKEQQIELLQEKRTALISHAVTKGLNPKAKRKDSRIAWLGEIPEHWRVCTFKRVANMSYGVGGELDRTLTKGIKILSLPNVGIDGTLMLDDIPYVDLADDQKPTLLLERGDLLFNWRNGSFKHLGKTAYFYLEGEYTHVSFLLRIRFNPEQHESRYFQLLLNGFQNTGFFASSKAGVNNTFNQSELENLWVMVPPIHEQKEIAHYLEKELSQIDKLISKIAFSISKLHEYRIAIISAAVTGKIDVRKEAA